MKVEVEKAYNELRTIKRLVQITEPVKHKMCDSFSSLKFWEGYWQGYIDALNEIKKVRRGDGK